VNLETPIDLLRAILEHF